MKIILEKYNPDWSVDFQKVNAELNGLLGFLNPIIEHIGSTSVHGLSAKPIIDILVGVREESDLGDTITPLVDNGYVYYEIFNKYMHYRRFFVKHKTSSKDLKTPKVITEENPILASTEEHSNRLAHIHIVPYNSEHWIRHVAFRDYLRAHSAVREQYQKLKGQLSHKEWIDGNDYNKAKDHFLKTEEANAVRWYQNK